MNTTHAKLWESPSSKQKKNFKTQIYSEIGERMNDIIAIVVGANTATAMFQGKAYTLYRCMDDNHNVNVYRYTHYHLPTAETFLDNCNQFSTSVPVLMYEGTRYYYSGQLFNDLYARRSYRRYIKTVLAVVVLLICFFLFWRVFAYFWQ